jgi:Pyruvate kinase, barrel domain
MKLVAAQHGYRYLPGSLCPRLCVVQPLCAHAQRPRAGETAAGKFPVEAVTVMTKICREAESSLDYYALFKSILKEAPSPMSPLESLASSAVRTAHKVRAQAALSARPEARSTPAVGHLRDRAHAHAPACLWLLTPGAAARWHRLGTAPPYTVRDCCRCTRN